MKDFGLANSSLKTLMFSECSLEHSFLTELSGNLARMPKLRHLDLSFNPLTTLNESFVASMTRFRDLNLECTGLTHFPAMEISAQPFLRRLDLSKNILSDEAVTFIAFNEKLS